MRKVTSNGRQFHSTSMNNVKVCVVGGAGGIGQPLSMLLKLNPAVTHVSVFDMVGAPGVAADLSHIDTPAKVTGHGMNLKQFTGDAQIQNKDEFQAAAFDDALKGCDIVVRFFFFFFSKTQAKTQKYNFVSHITHMSNKNKGYPCRCSKKARNDSPRLVLS
jgi:hypothetical protein